MMIQGPRLGLIGDFPPNRIVALEVGGLNLIAVRLGERLIVVENRCPHLDLTLDNGQVIEGRLVCLWHGAHFDLASGKNIRWAANEPDPPEDQARAAQTGERDLKPYPILVVDGVFYLGS